MRWRGGMGLIIRIIPIGLIAHVLLRQFPCRSDDLLLKLRQLCGLISLALLLLLVLLLLLLAVHPFALTEDFFKGPDLSEEQIALRAAHFAIGPDVIRP